MSTLSVADQEWMVKHMPSDNMFDDPRWIETTVDGLTMNIWLPDLPPVPVSWPLAALVNVAAMVVSFALVIVFQVTVL